MTGSKTKTFSLIEWVVLVIVLFATLSLNPAQEEEAEVEFQSSKITGTVELSTRSAMDSLGLEDFKLGPLATVDLVSNPVTSSNCTDCQHPVSGINVHGSVVITELVDQDDRQGRVEAILNLTYLREISPNDFIFREWLIFDWDAGDLSSNLEIKIVHDPPRWNPISDNHAAFIETDNGITTRSGPEILVQFLTDNKTSINGCLPDSFLCRASSPDVNLITTYSLLDQPVQINHPQPWIKYNISQLGSTPQETLSIRDLFELEQELEQTESWCPITNQPIQNSKSWEVSHSQSTISPLSSWLYALSIPTNSFTPTGEIWSEVEFAEFSCSTLTDIDGNLNIGIFFNNL